MKCRGRASTTVKRANQAPADVDRQRIPGSSNLIVADPSRLYDKIQADIKVGQKALQNLVKLPAASLLLGIWRRANNLATTKKGKTMIIEAIADYACETGEGPLWHPDEGRLYWLDIPPGKLYRYDPATGEHGLALDAGEAVGGYTIQADGSLLLFMARGRIAHWREGQPLKNLVDEIPAEREGRFNDVIADPAGRVFCGTMPRSGSNGLLYRLETDGSLAVALEDAGLSNGMGFSADQKTFYHSDTSRRAITRYDYDIDSGNISNPQVIVREGARANGHPDGMTMDAANFIWSARWDGYALVQHMPGGREIQRLTFPAPKVSSATFGGHDYTDLYVTTAGGHVRETDGPQAGTLFRVRLGVKGKPPFRSRINL